ncbi:MAG TPA: TetR family transcriptional regulator [Chloroflexaceae bacterium]|nr:TetR family transcriptional regulator [Chloroflexaceae bacterium]
MSPRTPEQNQALRDETRGRIIRAALARFSGDGYERTTVKAIAEAAGVAQGLMYSHFAGKEELLRAIFQQSIQDVYASFALAASGGDGPPTVEAIIRAAFVTVGERLEFWRLSYGVRMQQSVLAALGPELSTWVETIRQTLERSLRAAGVAAPEVEARLLFAAIDGVCQHYVIDPEGYPLEAVVEALVARYTRQGAMA